MGKKKRTRREEDFNDKPEWAADLFRPDKAPKKNEKPAPVDPDLTIGARVGSGAAEKLAALRTAMEAEVPKGGEGKAGGKTSPVKPGGHPAVRRPGNEDDHDLSFAELFDPVEEEDSSFDELLKSSKLDWRSFKDE